MKTVFSNSMVAHVWAQQTQDEGRSNNGNFWFKGDTIYSYRTPIARFVPTGTAGRIVLMSSENYSPTTAGKHMRPIGAAVNYDYIRVPYIGRGDWNEAPQHDKNLAYLVEQYTNEVGRINRARSAPSNYCWEHLAKLADLAIKYANAFGMAEPALNSFADRRQIEEARAVRDAKNNTPAAIAARERKKVREAAKLQELIGDYEGAWRAGGVRASVLKLTREQRRAYDDLLRSKIMMRVEGEEILTSLGARFPIEHGKRAFAFILERRMRGEAWETNGHKIHLGHFVIDSIDAAGNVKAGCHFVKWEEVERMARTLGLLPPQPEQVAA